MKPYQIHAEHALAAEGNFPGQDRRPPGWLLERLAEEKLTGGYSNRKNPVCPECHLRKANNRSCGCGS
jgi:hypothetical protein